MIWQIEKIEHIDENSLYFDLNVKDNNVWIGNWDGNKYRIDPETGKIIEKRFTK